MDSRSMNRVSVFVDSSVLFAASISVSGFARDLLVLGLQSSVRFYLSDFAVRETRGNLERKYPTALPFFDTFVASGVGQYVEPPASLVKDVATLVVAQDAPIVAGAVAAPAQYLVSYDRKHLLSQAAIINEHYGLSITTPDVIVELVNAGRLN